MELPLVNQEGRVREGRGTGDRWTETCKTASVVKARKSFKAKSVWMVLADLISFYKVTVGTG